MLPLSRTSKNVMTALSRFPQSDRIQAAEMNGQTVARYLVQCVPVAGWGESVGEARARLIGGRFDDASHVFLLTEDGRLVGVVAIRDLLGAAETTALQDIARAAEGYSVSIDADREDAASIAIRSGLSILAVCDEDGRLLGAVPARALMTILRDEHLEDLHHMVGILGKSEAAKDALTAAPHRRALYRLPWLLVGMTGSAAATAMMSRFETALSAHIAVAFFIPAIVYLADSVGTQSEVVVVRGLSLTDSALLPLFLGELGTGALLGSMLGCLAFPIVWFFFSSVGLAATVGISLAVASTIATAFGFLMPWLFARLGYDAALGSGPVATVVQDTFSLMTYFVVASWLVF
jgi:magnesium transporter